MKDPNPILPDRPWLVLQAVRKGGAAHWATLHLAETAQAAWAWLTLFPADPAPATGDDIQCHDNEGR